VVYYYRFLQFIPKTKRGFAPTVPVPEIIIAILYKLKTGVQWNQLPIKPLFQGYPWAGNLSSTHYRKWCCSGSCKGYWMKFLHGATEDMNLSNVDLDGSHTPAIRGRASVEY